VGKTLPLNSAEIENKPSKMALKEKKKYRKKKERKEWTSQYYLDFNGGNYVDLMVGGVNQKEAGGSKRK